MASSMAGSNNCNIHHPLQHWQVNTDYLLNNGSFSLFLTITMSFRPYACLQDVAVSVSPLFLKSVCRNTVHRFCSSAYLSDVAVTVFPLFLKSVCGNTAHRLTHFVRQTQVSCFHHDVVSPRKRETLVLNQYVCRCVHFVRVTVNNQGLSFKGNSS